MQIMFIIIIIMCRYRWSVSDWLKNIAFVQKTRFYDTCVCSLPRRMEIIHQTRISCAEILDLLRILWDVVLDRAITTQGVDKSILYVNSFSRKAG